MTHLLIAVGNSDINKKGSQCDFSKRIDVFLVGTEYFCLRSQICPVEQKSKVLHESIKLNRYFRFTTFVWWQIFPDEKLSTKKTLYTFTIGETLLISQHFEKNSCSLTFTLFECTLNDSYIFSTLVEQMSSDNNFHKLNNAHIRRKVYASLRQYIKKTALFYGEHS